MTNRSITWGSRSRSSNKRAKRQGRRQGRAKFRTRTIWPSDRPNLTDGPMEGGINETRKKKVEEKSNFVHEEPCHPADLIISTIPKEKRVGDGSKRVIRIIRCNSIFSEVKSKIKLLKSPTLTSSPGINGQWWILESWDLMAEIKTLEHPIVWSLMQAKPNRQKTHWRKRSRVQLC